MKKISYLFTCLLFQVFVMHAQSLSLLKNEDALKNELSKSKYDIDSNATAIILYESGSVDFEDAAYNYKYEVIAKILSDEAIKDLAEVAIPKRENTNVLNISAETYNLTNGTIEKSKLASENILKDQIDKNLKVFKFNIPNVKKGSIIHYTYKIRKESSFNLPEWTFQNIYPTLRSRYTLSLPYTISFSKILRSSKSFAEVKNIKELESCDACEYFEKYEATGFYTSWSIKDIPAFQEEPYSSSKNNFLDRIKVIISKFYKSNGDQEKLFNTWDDFSKKYLFGNEEYIGQVFKSNGFLDETVNEIIKNNNTDLDKAHAIFNYVKSNYVYVDNDDINIKSVFKNKKGDIFGVNMLLIAMMKHANLNCDPVILTTKANERLSNLYPSPYSIDYLIADFKDKEKSYFLDATGANLPFGILKPECYNGYSRIVNKTGAGLVLSPDDIKDKTTTIINIEPTKDNAELSIKVEEKLGIFKGINLRNASKGDLAEATKSLIESLTGNAININPTSVQLKNFDNTDEQIIVGYEGTLKLDKEDSTIYMSPFFSKFYTKNPFAATQRTLPIEMDYKEDVTYILNFKLPEGYLIDDYPKSINVKLGDEGSMLFSNTFNYDQGNRTFSLCSKFQTATTFFPANEYKNIREMFQRVIEEQNKKIVLKKTQG